MMLRILTALVFLSGKLMAQPAAADPIFDYIAVDTPPSFPGGEIKLLQALSKCYRLPDGMTTDSLQGFVVQLSFIVRSNGVPEQFRIGKDICRGCGDALIACLQNLPPWLPGQKNGQPVATRYQLPFRIRVE
jgi:protein TonB